TPRKYYGWVERNGKYYFYNRTTGVMQKGGTQAGITLNADGSAVMNDYSKQKLPVLVRAREIVESITNPNDSLSVKKMKCYQYIADMPYLLKMYQFYQNKDRYTCPDAVYANNLLNAYGDQDKCGGECVAEASALGYLYAELNFGDVYLLASGHGWIKAGDYYWDPLLVEDRGMQWYEYAPDNRKYEFIYKIN
ncbi:MAG: hypothetical protein IJ054_01570, partial [Lachnospiraceae bacterium]|nr:hypothetical protein [Lachnospiraceae bacterium]